MMSTVLDTRGVVTANTEGQLRTKTWPELAKWHALSINKEWFTYSATSLCSSRPGRDRTWRVAAITWSENNTEAIAGLHHKGALTDAGTDLFRLAFGNPTRTTGRFRECFAGGRFAHRWQPQQIDSRSVSMTNKAQIATWVKDYGEDSDFVRIRVKGEFPRAGSMQFIDSERVQQAVERALPPDWNSALVMGVDIARHGDDQTVIRFRRGLDARSIPPVKFRVPDLMVIASRVMELVCEHSPDAVFVDGTGIGWGVVDRLAQLGCSTVLGVDFGSKADRTDGVDGMVRYANKRAEMWGYMKEWCKAGCLPDDRELRADLTAIDYGYDAADAILLEKKDDMRRRGLASPDDGDALALTFAYPVSKTDWAEERGIEEKLKRLKRYVV